MDYKTGITGINLSYFLQGHLITSKAVPLTSQFLYLCELLQPGIGNVWAVAARDTSAVILAREALRSAMKLDFIPSLYSQGIQNRVRYGYVCAGSTWSKTDTLSWFEKFVCVGRFPWNGEYKPLPSELL